jgi:predicted PurR-regulated permease PerM
MNIQKNNLKILILVILFVSLTFFFIYALGAAKAPLIFALGLAYLSYPFLRSLEKKGIPRTFSILGIFLSLSLIVIGVSALTLPLILSDLRTFITEFPDIFQRSLNRLQALANSWGWNLETPELQIQIWLRESIASLSRDTLQSLTQTAGKIFSNFIFFIMTVINLLLIPLFYFFVMNEYEKIEAAFKSLIPLAFRPQVQRAVDITDEVFAGFIRGQFSVAGILALYYSLFLSLIGLKFGFLVGILTGLFSIIPYLGFAGGFIASISLALANSDGLYQVVLVVLIFAVAQVVESFVLTPKLVGNKVGISPLISLLAIIAGGNLFGFWGVLLAIPAAGLLKRILIWLRAYYLDSIKVFQ